MGSSLFAPDALLFDGGWFGIWRAGANGAVVGIRIEGALDDERNPVWRAKFDELAEREGWPRFVALDVRDAIPAASLARRMQTAAWGRRTLARIEHATLGIGADGRVSVTVRAILRIAGMNNVTLRSDDDAFFADVDAMLAGKPRAVT
jgi:hypothetical protein